MRVRHLASSTAAFAALALVALLTGCASAGTPGGPVSAGPTGGPPTSIPPSGGVTSGPPPLQDPTVRVSEPVNTVTPEPSVVGLTSRPWTRAEPVPGESAVLVYGTLTGGPPCAVIGRIDVAETATSVRLTVHVGRRSGANCSGVQTQLAFPYVTKVRLQAPVGERTITDGA